ncbi:MAG TPA: cysteine desulfurase, partial [Clostridiaceae bacterium]|nr:cysteine desulfurase [Clostridiaceae bacterium]
MNKLYLDNAATSYPKAPKVSEKMCEYINKVGSNVSRGIYSSSKNAGQVVYKTREMLCDLFNFDEPLNVVFTKNITESLNTIIKGYLKDGDHVIVSSME